MGPRRRAVCACAVLAAGLLFAPAQGNGTRLGGGPNQRVVGGGPANAGGWRFVTALKLRKSAFFCGGALIAPTKVVTAAHCVKRTKRRKLLVATGTPWLSGPRAARRLPVARVRIHPDYNGEKVFNDIAVVTLARPSPATPVQLPSPSEARAATRPGDIVRVAGWGSRSAWGFRAAQRLKAARQRVYRSRKCQRAYRKGGFRGSTMVCAVGARIRRFRGALRIRATDCFGDSGGPLVASTPAGPRLVGVVSVGSFPCGFGAPSIYTRVSEALPFIRRVAGL